MNIKFVFAICGIGTNLLALPASSSGGLDTSFASEGQAVFAEDIWVEAALTQTDGKIVLAGSKRTDFDSDFAVLRLLEDGSPDTDFGTNGEVRLDFGGFDYANAVGLQPDGRVIVAGCSEYLYLPDGSCQQGIAVRLNVDGSLDGSFADEGRFVDTLDQVNVYRAVAIQRDGKILIVGARNQYLDNFGFNIDLMILRLQANGTPDMGFGVQGIATFDWMQRHDTGIDVVPQDDGSVLVVGTVGEDLQSYGLNSKIAVLRLLSNGTPDMGFGASGWRVFSPGMGGAEATRLQVQSDGRLLVELRSEEDILSCCDQGLVRLEPNGNGDSGFGQHGTSRDFTSIAYAYQDTRASGSDADGSIWVASAHATYFSSPNLETKLFGNGLLIEKLTSDGKRDTVFGLAGSALTDTGPSTGTFRSIQVRKLLPVSPGRVLVVANVDAVLQVQSANQAARQGRHSGAVVAMYRADDPVGGTVALDSDTVQLEQPAATADVIVHRTGGSQGDASVEFHSFDGDALAGRDYTAVSGRLEWPDGDASDRLISVPILSADFPSGMSRRFGVRLEPVDGEIALGIGTVAVQLFSPATVSPPPPPPPPPGGGGATGFWLTLALGTALILRKKLAA